MIVRHENGGTGRCSQYRIYVIHSETGVGHATVTTPCDCTGPNTTNDGGR